MNIRYKLGVGFGLTMMAVGAVFTLSFVMLGLLAEQWVELSTIMTRREETILQSAIHLGNANLSFKEYLYQGGGEHAERFTSEIDQLDRGLDGYRALGVPGGDERVLLDRAATQIRQYRASMRTLAELRGGAAAADSSPLAPAWAGRHDQLLAQTLRQLTDLSNRHVTDAAGRVTRRISGGREALLACMLLALLATLGTAIAVIRSIERHMSGRERAIDELNREIDERRRAQDALRANRNLLQAIIDNSTAVIFVKDLDGRYQLINQRYADLFHIDKEAILGRRDHDVFDAPVADAVLAADRRVLAAGAALEFEETVPQDDGWHTYLALKFPLREDSGRIYAVCGIATDISERKRAEERFRALNQSLEQRVGERTRALRDTETRLREALSLNEDILTATTAGILAYRHDGQCVLTNPAAAELVGGSQPQLLAQNFRRIGSWRQSGLLEAAERVLASGAKSALDARLHTTFGRAIWIHAQFSPFISQGEPLLLLVLYDITESRRAADALAEREREFRSLADNVPDNIARYALDGRLLYLNRTLIETLGRPAEELLGKSAGQAWPDGRFDALQAAVLEVAGSGLSAEFEQVVPGEDGQPRYHAIRIVAEAGADGRPAGVLAVGRDLTGQRNAEEALRLAASVFHNTMEGVMITDAAARILSVNPAFTEITGYGEAEALGCKPSLLRSERHDQPFYDAIWQTLNEEGHWRGEIWNRRKDGEAYLEWLTINRIDDAGGAPVRYVAVFHDITEMRRKDERIHHLAYHDALTELPNRALMLDRLQHAVQRARRENGRLSVTFIDLDRFKHVNDTLGHDIGDLLLQEVARRMQGRLRAADTVARLGGDEFVVLMEDLQERAHCTALARELIAEIARPMTLRGHAIEIGASVGIAFLPEDAIEPLELMKRADMAMYAAKAAGRNTWRVFHPDMMERAGQHAGA